MISGAKALSGQNLDQIQTESFCKLFKEFFSSDHIDYYVVLIFTFPVIFTYFLIFFFGGVSVE